MIFVYKKWKNFCSRLQKDGFTSIPLKEVQKSTGKYISFKHDVETKVKKAYKIAKIENEYGHRGSYYVQAYLLNDKNNVDLLNKIKKLGHEITYHHDVMDSNKGIIDKAIIEFKNNVELFNICGFNVETVCQHGNPVIERKGYNSNRDFFRNDIVQKSYPNICDIMVDFKLKRKTEYNYYSDAGRKFKFIYDPINNDIIDTESKNVSYKNLDELYQALLDNKSAIISIHPHRWTTFASVYLLKAFVFKVIKYTAKVMIKIPLFRKIFSKYYYLAKKI